MKKTTKIGLKDIAAQSGVSSAAVSLVLNNRPGVSDETRERVSDVAKKLGYKSKQSRRIHERMNYPTPVRSIGFYAFGVNAGIEHNYYGDILSGASSGARDLDSQLFFESFDSGMPDIDELVINSVDGLLLTGRPPLEFVEKLQKEQVPYVLVCCSLSHLPGHKIGPENVESSYQVINYLAKLGHKRIAYLGGEPVNTDARERYLGYRWAVEDLKLDDDPNLSLLSYFDVEYGKQGLKKLLEQAGEFSAIYAASDFLALGVYQCARELGISIPDDLSVCGFDNNNVSETLYPTLSTMNLDRKRVGSLAIRQLNEIILDPLQRSIDIRVPTDFIVRHSCAQI